MPGSRTVRVVEAVRETADAVSLVLDAGGAELPYRPGQFLTVRIPGRGARCYSLASSPHTGEPPRITVKRVPGGVGSGWMCDEVAVGDELEVLPPAGTFGPADLDRDLLLVAGGSGITPVVSVAKSALAAGRARVALVYANRDEPAVIFRDELRELAEDYPSRFTLIHWLESLQGLPTADALTATVAPYAARDTYLCGPGPLMDAAEAAVRATGGRTVRRERYFSLADDVFDRPAAADTPSEDAPAYTARVVLDGDVHAIPGGRDVPLLDALLKAGVDAPYSCREGACAACTCRIVAGEVKLLRNEVLTDADLADGYTLACQAVPLSDHVEVTYDE
ncbi:ferredoxin--NADP reductase [Streptomyces solicathayae]|uniref:Ferredoxin--NADP reductase n=1 Tax=Streptomyces solicathayae TaxID=3081768 RepID=A0ABZ0LZP6_9ACTN|nr:ferredoxin--NADP reductase [Streptomyces sp. HUAS YS2]WOX24984.1 ferredoxin--NADP reductase [Streptomyces sp. HUAS YS2]